MRIGGVKEAQRMNASGKTLDCLAQISGFVGRSEILLTWASFSGK